MSRLTILIVVMLSFLISDNLFAQSLYHQLGAVGSANLDNSQGVSTQITTREYPNVEVNGGGRHYHWIATGIKEPGGDAFTQMGWTIACDSCPIKPFIFVSEANVPDSNIFVIYNYTIPEDIYVTFRYQQFGNQNPDGTYNWKFYFNYPAIDSTELVTLKFNSQYCGSPYAVSEVAGSSAPCNDKFSITYGNQSDNYRGLWGFKDGTWQHANHATAYYGYENCTSNVIQIESPKKRFRTNLPQTRTTCSGCQIW